MNQKNLSRSISVDVWHALAKEGAAPPVTIPLDGNSMLPLIRRGVDPVTIIPLQRALKKGDVVLLTTGAGRYVVHRVFKIRGNRVQTLGDNCVYPDPWIAREDVLGQAVCFSRKGRKRRLDTASARLWGRAWMALFPLRKRWLKCRSFLSRCYRRHLK